MSDVKYYKNLVDKVTTIEDTKLSKIKTVGHLIHLLKEHKFWSNMLK
jgi:hypothetical protein